MMQNNLTKWEWFAGQALMGILANPHWNTIQITLHGLEEKECFKLAASISDRYAAAMLSEMENK